ncbi:dickkopf-related protein 2-like isoform X1 [Anguilla rostrata]|uniref:dickkopf-related protein 2-like isoform X1 n=1 Tax=Anguilla rostrata TaxID=7938 RepID=UPI0030D50974
MLELAWTRCWCFFILLGAVIRMEEVGAKVNAIKSVLLEEPPTQSTNHSANHQTGTVKKANPIQVYHCSADKECTVGSYCHAPHHGPSRCLNCRRRKRRCHRDSMCCPGNRCSSYICVPISESVLPPQIPALEEHNKLPVKRNGWKKNGKAHSKLPLSKGHEGAPCLRSSDCADGNCCARHFWTKICKPVLRQGEVCTRQRRKGSHGLEIFQRCDCAKGLACKAWRDASAATKSRLHMCQRV